MRVTYNPAITLVLEIIKICHPKDIFSLVCRSLYMVNKLRFGWSLEDVLRFSKCPGLFQSFM